MSASSENLRKIFDEARPLVEQALDLSDKFKGFRELATANGLDWSQIKALLKAQIQDEREDDGKNRVGRIIEKADFATAYADMLGLGTPKMNENNFSSDLPPHDEDGVIIDLPPAEPVRPSADIQGSGPPAEENGPLLNNGPATAPAPGAGGITPAKDDAGGINEASASAPCDASSTLSEPASAPSDAAAGQGDVAERQQPEGLAFLTSSVAPPSIPEPATAPPKAVAAAPVEQSPSPDNAPGAPIAGEMPDIPAFLRRIA